MRMVLAVVPLSPMTARWASPLHAPLKLAPELSRQQMECEGHTHNNRANVQRLACGMYDYHRAYVSFIYAHTYTTYTCRCKGKCSLLRPNLYIWLHFYIFVFYLSHILLGRSHWDTVSSRESLVYPLANSVCLCESQCTHVSYTKYMKGKMGKDGR